ncbi:MAG: SGNH/GDSL hydrolase family protein [Chitinophagaceae bacterium]
MLGYLALGDSYTIGESVPTLANFPHQLVSILQEKDGQITPPRIIATTGWTTDELAAAIREAKIQDSFSLVTLLIGVNNQYRGRSLENYKEEFASLLNHAIVFANGHARHVVVLSIPDWGVTPFAEGRDRSAIAQEIDAYNAAAKEISLAHTCAWLDITDSTKENGQKAEFLAKDGLHPSGKEYAIWAERLAAIVEKILK